MGYFIASKKESARSRKKRGGGTSNRLFTKKKRRERQKPVQKNKLTLYTESAIVHIPAVNNDTHQNKGLNIRFLKI